MDRFTKEPIFFLNHHVGVVKHAETINRFTGGGSRLVKWVWNNYEPVLVGMLGEAVKNPEMAQRYVNQHTHTHTTHTSAKTYSFQKFL